jgi:hypothetical protein
MWGRLETPGDTPAAAFYAAERRTIAMGHDVFCVMTVFVAIIRIKRYPVRGFGKRLVLAGDRPPASL